MSSSGGGAGCSWSPHLLSHLTTGHGRADVVDLLRQPGPSSRPVALLVDLADIMQRGDSALDDCSLSVFGSEVLLEPEAALAEADAVLREACRKVFSSLEGAEKLACTPKDCVKVRVSRLPNFPQFCRQTLPCSEDVGLLVELKGTVIRTTVPKVLEKAKTMSCARCRKTFLARADFEQFYRLDRPASCPADLDCPGTYFTPVADAGGGPNLEFCADYQEVKIQERAENLSLGAIPRSMWVVLEDDLVDSCKPGDDVGVIGVIKRRWHPLGKAVDGRTDIELAVQASHVEVSNDQRSAKLVTDELADEFRDFWERHETNPLAGRDLILESFCPQVYGMFSIKLALAVVLCGGVERVDDSGTRVRGEPHMLLVGDPGTGKSQLIRYASKLSARSVLTTGIGSTTAGLTVSAVKDSGSWQLEAGALVLADGGVCCIDEFNSIGESDRACIHEAMEQQSISVAKAGMVCKLQTRCTVLAATNPKGSYDPTQPLTVNAAIASPLLSRFDLVFVLLDLRNEEWDRLVATYVLEGRDPYAEQKRADARREAWTMEKLQAYFSYCKRFNPHLGEEASAILSGYYRRQRSADNPNMARTTVRLLQSAIRLAQGHARLLCRHSVTVQDAVFSVLLLEASMESGRGLDCASASNPLHTSFPEDPASDYRYRAEGLLRHLGLDHLWPAERRRLAELARREAERGPAVSPKRPPAPSQAAGENPEGAAIMMTQVLSKIRTKQISYGAECVAAESAAGGKRKRKASAVKEWASGKRRKKKKQKTEVEEVEKEQEEEEVNGAGEKEKQRGVVAEPSTFKPSKEFTSTQMSSYSKPAFESSSSSSDGEEEEHPADGTLDYIDRKVERALSNISGDEGSVAAAATASTVILGNDTTIKDANKVSASTISKLKEFECSQSQDVDDVEERDEHEEPNSVVKEGYEGEASELGSDDLRKGQETRNEESRDAQDEQAKKEPEAPLLASLPAVDLSALKERSKMAGNLTLVDKPLFEDSDEDFGDF